MKLKKVYLVIESLLCILTAAALIAAAVRMYMEGAAVQASGNLFYYIYTREKVGEQLTKLLPLMISAVVMAIPGLILGIYDKNAGKPAKSTSFLRALTAKGMESPEKAVPRKNTRTVRTLRIVVLMLALLLILLGIRNGGAGDVFAKGASICTECIGLG